MSETAEQSSEYTTPSGITLERVYGPGSVKDDKIGSAGKPPYTRGVHTDMYRSRLWTMRQYAGFGTASETNKRFRFLLEGGQTGLSTAFDLPTQIGHDADAPAAEGEVGRVGVHIGSINDMRTLFDGIPLGEVSTSMTINATAPVLLALYTAVAQEQGADLKMLRGTVQNDVLKEYLARGTYIYPVEHAMRMATDLIVHSVEHLPKWNPISISGYHIREAGADAVQEIAFTLGNAEAYIEAALDRGLSIDAFAPRLAFFFGCHNHFLEEIAKFRAARRLWHRIVVERYGAKDPRSSRLRFHTQTCGATLTSDQPHNNVMRVALQAMAAVLGGTQSLHTNSFDEALALPTEQSASIALRTQQILALETGVPDTVDPVAGSYAIESLTDEIEERAWKTLERVRAMGGMIPAISKGVVQAEIQESAYLYQKDIETKRRKIVGINCYEESASDRKKSGPATLKVSPQLEEEQKKRLAAFKSSRDGAAAAKAVLALTKAGASKENLFPIVSEAVKRGATVGEICNGLRTAFGEYNGA